jgi:hypothetical protein
MTMEEIAAKLHAERQAMRRELSMAATVVAFCVIWFAFIVGAESDPVRRAGVLLILGGLVFQGGQMLAHVRRVRSLRDDPARTTADSLTSMRMYLVVRYRFHTGRWLWSRGVALLPGVPLVAYGFARDPDTADMLIAGVPVQWVPVAWIGLLACAALFVQLPVARRYKRQLDELDRLRQ